MKLNYGCGSVHLPGYVNVDIQDYGQDVKVDLLAGLPFTDGAFESIIASHSVQEIPYDDLIPGLEELRRVLRPGGVLRILVPDIAVACGRYLEHDIEYFPINDNEPSLDDKFCLYINWFGTARSLFTRQRLFNVCLRAGFYKAEWERYGEGVGGEHDNREPERALIVVATK